MMEVDGPVAGNQALRDEALARLRHLTSGTATTADVAALDCWRGESAEHAQAFAEAALLWEVLGDASRLVTAERPDVARLPARPALGRRAFLTGGGALAASLAGLAVVRPPLRLWPSLSEWAADWRTRRGERRQIEIAAGTSIELNTQTSVDRRQDGTGRPAIELISGEAAVAADSPAAAVVVLAGAGRAECRQGTFDIRKTGQTVAVTCLDGKVDVRLAGDRASLLRGQQIRYGEGGLGQVVQADPDTVGAWRSGFLIFRDEPLAQVIAEVNRYRPGKIILVDSALVHRRVVATFRLDRIDDAVTFIHQAMNVPVHSLPGGIVLLG